MKPFYWQARVYYEDTDAGGVVYYANYLKFLERARSEWLRALGLQQDQLRAEYAIVFAVRAVNIEYIKPARFDDLLIVSVENIQLRLASVSLRQIITKAEHKSELMTRATVNIVSIDSETFSPRAIPKSIFKVLKTCT